MLSSSKGQLALLKVQLKAAQKDIECYLPTNNEGAVDLILKEKNNLIKCQIKYCNRKGFRKNTLKLALDNKHSKRKFYSSKNIDIILVFIPKLDVILKYDGETFHKRSYIDIHLKNEKSKHYYGKYVW